MPNRHKGLYPTFDGGPKSGADLLSGMFNETIRRGLAFETIADDHPALADIGTGRLYDIARLLNAEGHASCARDLRAAANLFQDIHDRLQRMLQ